MSERPVHVPTDDELDQIDANRGGISVLKEARARKLQADGEQREAT